MEGLQAMPDNIYLSGGGGGNPCKGLYGGAPPEIDCVLILRKKPTVLQSTPERGT